MAVLFDTLKLADRLEAAGMSPRQAHDVAAAFADTMTSEVATKRDLAELKTEVRGWLIAQTAIIAALIGIAAALARLIH